MSVFSERIKLAATPDGPSEEVDAVVDTGTFHSWVPRSILTGLGLRPMGRMRFAFVDGREFERDVTEVVVRLNGSYRHTLCVMGDEGTEALLGALTLEEFGLLVDVHNQRLIPIERFRA